MTLKPRTFRKSPEHSARKLLDLGLAMSFYVIDKTILPRKPSAETLACATSFISQCVQLSKLKDRTIYAFDINTIPFDIILRILSINRLIVGDQSVLTSALTDRTCSHLFFLEESMYLGTCILSNDTQWRLRILNYPNLTPSNVTAPEIVFFKYIEDFMNSPYAALNTFQL